MDSMTYGTPVRPGRRSHRDLECGGPHLGHPRGSRRADLQSRGTRRCKPSSLRARASVAGMKARVATTTFILLATVVASACGGAQPQPPMAPWAAPTHPGAGAILFGLGVGFEVESDLTREVTLDHVALVQ